MRCETQVMLWTVMLTVLSVFSISRCTPLHYVMLLPCNFPGLQYTAPLFLRCRTWTNETRYSLGCLRLSVHPMKTELKCNDTLLTKVMGKRKWDVAPHTTSTNLRLKWWAGGINRFYVTQVPFCLLTIFTCLFSVYRPTSNCIHK